MPARLRCLLRSYKGLKLSFFSILHLLMQNRLLRSYKGLKPRRMIGKRGKPTSLLRSYKGLKPVSARFEIVLTSTVYYVPIRD